MFCFIENYYTTSVLYSSSLFILRLKVKVATDFSESAGVAKGEVRLIS